MSLTGLITIVASPLSLNSGTFSIPEGWLICDGRSYLKSDYLNLYNHLLKDGPNSIYSSTNEPLYGGDADNFNVPDLNNRFMRGWGGSENLQPGQDISEKVDITGISVEPSISQLTLTSNSRAYSPTSQSISSEGHHTHQYARDGGSGGISLESNGLENYDTGFFHTRPADPGQLQTGGRPVHLKDDRSGAVGEICSLKNDVEHYSMWSIIQGGSQGYELAIPSASNTLLYWQKQFQQQDMAQLSIRRRTFVSMKNPIWQNSNQRVWNHNEYQSNTAIRHIHKYTINVFQNGDHQHTVSSSPQNHTHGHTISDNPTVQSTGASGQELRPANTKMVFLIYAL
tara:strand:- start:1046 stop:2068 length:1023 start_codon:yes stop_codon:yes gene_type:complete